MAKSKGRLLSELAEAPKNEDYADVNALPNTGNKVGDQAFVEETDRLYIWNGSGWYNIALINTTPTWDSGGQPAGSYVLDADSPQDATTITLAASDPEGIPISYSYVTGGSMDSIATVSQDSSVFTITPKTEVQAPDGGTGTITFRASDGVNILPQVSSFTLTFVTVIENSRYTTLLASATGTSDNNNITDASTNNHSITVTGDAHAGTFSPYRSGGYSTYFDGNGDYLGLSDNSSFDLPSEFAWECWIYRKGNGSGGSGAYQAILGANGSSSNGFTLYITQATGALSLFQSSFIITGSANDIVDNEWTHILLMRDSSNLLQLFINGTRVSSSTNTTSFTDNSSGSGLRIGYDINANAAFNGYISDVRLFKGSTGGYSSGTSIIVPTAPLSSTSTELHTCHLPYIADGSTNDHSITINGDPETKPFSPYDYLEYSATDHGGSVYFDGSSGDYLAMPVSNDFQFGTGDFTIETWAKVLDTSIDAGRRRIFIQKNEQSASSIFEIIINTDGTIQAYGNADILASTTSFTNGSWGHIAFVRDSGTLKVYINGKLENSVSNTTNFSPSSPNPVIGIYPFGGVAKFHGYISDFKITKSAVYTADFTPPTAPPSSSGTLLHLKGTDASIIDKSQGSNLKLEGSTTGSTTQVKFASSKSMYFPGSLGDQIIATSGENVNLSSADPFTWEAWCYFNSVSGVIHLMSSEDVGYTQDRIAFELRNSKLAAMFGGSVIQSGSQVLSTGQWYHLAISRAVGSPYTTTRFFVNGNLDQTNSAHQQAVAIGNFDKWYIGSPTTNNVGNGYHEFNGYMQDVRFTEGLTRYTANFTPPTASLEG